MFKNDMVPFDEIERVLQDDSYLAVYLHAIIYDWRHKEDSHFTNPEKWKEADSKSYHEFQTHALKFIQVLIKEGFVRP